MPAWNRNLSATNMTISERIMAGVYQMPLISITDLAGCLRLSTRTIRTHTNDPATREKIEGRTLAATHRPTERRYLTEDAARAMGQGYAGWNSRWGLSTLLKHLPMVEHFYKVAAQCSGDHGVYGFQWIFGDAIDAAARLTPETWIALIWSGYWETEDALYEKMLSIDADLRRMGVSATDPAVPDPAAIPTAIVFVTCDLWQAQLVRRAAYRAGMTGWVNTYCASTGDWPHGPMLPRKSRGWIYWPLTDRDLGSWSWERRLDDSLASRPDGLTLHKTRDALTQWSGNRTTVLARLAGGERLDRLNEALAALIPRRMAERVELERPASSQPEEPTDPTAKPDVRYGAGSIGVSQIAERDRVSPAMSARRSRALTWNDEKYRAQRRHEDLVHRVMAAFGRAKCPVAAGYRCSERFPGGGVYPDGLVYFNNGPFGPRWYYIEVELSAVFPKRASRKISGYASTDRRLFFPGDDEPPPVLWMVRNERMEKIYHQAADGLSMLTTPMNRWNFRAPFEGWSYFGDMVALS